MSDDSETLGRILGEVSGARAHRERLEQAIAQFERRLHKVEVDGTAPHRGLREDVRELTARLLANDVRHDARLDALEQDMAESRGRSKGLTAGLTLAAGGTGAGLSWLIDWLRGSGGH